MAGWLIDFSTQAIESTCSCPSHAALPLAPSPQHTQLPTPRAAHPPSSTHLACHISCLPCLQPTCAFVTPFTTWATSFATWETNPTANTPQAAHTLTLSGCTNLPPPTMRSMICSCVHSSRIQSNSLPASRASWPSCWLQGGGGEGCSGAEGEAGMQRGSSCLRHEKATDAMQHAPYGTYTGCQMFPYC